MEKMNVKRFGSMIDCSRNAVMKVDAVKKWMDICADMGHNMVMIYTEDTYEVDGHLYFGYARGRYSKEEMKEMDRYAASKGLELIPYIQTLAHIKSIFRWWDYRVIQDIDDILLCEDERTYALIDKMFATLAECFTTRTVNVGMDEAHHIARGQYYDKHGDSNHKEVLLRHVQRVAEIADKYGFRICMWSDMFIRLASGQKDYIKPDAVIDPNVKKLIPANVELIYWDYYNRDKAVHLGMLDRHAELADNSWYAGGVWTWEGFTTQNAYSIEALKSSLEACREKQVENIIITTWGDNGGECSRFEALPALFFASQYVAGNADMENIKQKFKEKFGVDFDDFLLFDGTERYETERDYLTPSKYLLYNDALIGLLDAAVPENCAEEYRELCTLLDGLRGDSQWGYLFDTQYKLSRVIAEKCDVGIKLRAAYKAGDKEELKKLAEKLLYIKALVKEFYDAFKKQWFAENKAHGFEVQDIRFGGLMTRLDHCAERVAAYADGKTDAVEELEADVLHPLGTVDKMELKREYIAYNKWHKIVSASDVAGIT